MMRKIYLFAIIGLLIASCTKESDVVNMLPGITTGNFVTHSRTSATLEGSVNLNGSTVESVGIVYADDPNMVVNAKYITADIENFNAPNSFSLEVNGLSAGHTYYYRSFVHSSNQYYYGEYKMFTTPHMSAPTFDEFTIADDAVDAAQMQLKAKISDIGVEENSGIALSNPSFKYKVVSAGTDASTVTFSDNDASWVTVPATYDTNNKMLTATAIELKSSTSYAVCAYASTVGYAISNIVVVTTDVTEVPEVSAVDIISSDNTGIGIQLRASVTNTGSSAVTERGFVYSTNSEYPLYEGSTAVVADESFTCEINNLPNSMKYYIRAYARNDHGIGYGSVSEYTTPNVVITPVILTVTVNDVKASSAVLVGYMDTKGLDVKEVGFVVNGQRIPVNVSDNGTFYYTLTNLNPSTQYPYSTYCVLSSGVEYIGDQKTFTTKNAPVDDDVVYPGLG